MELRDVYAKKAISQIPRLLTLEDRNEFSPTYGCFKRTYWLDRAVDFPDALPQFGVHSLALVYANKFPDNIYYKKEKIKRWCIAGIDFWTKIQKKDGSFDEFYPNEHGWAGPTGFLLYAVLESSRLLKDSIDSRLRDKILEATQKAAKYLIKYDEQGILANHHAIALTAIYSAYKELDDERILQGFHKKFRYFETLQSKEGWSLEYDGTDIGYLSATVSFLGKLYKMHKDPKVLQIAKDSIKFTSYFAYPNGYYAGSMGSRQTLHFYPHGYELFGKEFPLAQTVADKMLIGLKQGKLVPPEIMADRYFLYRVPEFLLAYLDYKPRPKNLPELPYAKPFKTYFNEAGILALKKANYYLLVNAAKGGVIKIFNKDRLIYNDDGIIGKLKDGKAVTSQWIDKDYKKTVTADSIEITGNLHKIPSKTMTPFKNLIFRSAMLSLGWQTDIAYHMKGLIRNLLIFGSKTANVEFRRSIVYKEHVEVKDIIIIKGEEKFSSLKIGDEFFVRYVPQSLYFQPEELNIKGFCLSKSQLRTLNQDRKIVLKRAINPDGKLKLIPDNP